MTIDTLLKTLPPPEREPHVLDAPKPVEDETLLQFMDRVDVVLREMDRLLGAYNREVGILRQALENEHQNVLQALKRIEELEKRVAPDDVYF